MHNIALVPSYERIRRIFSERDLQVLQGMGKVRVNTIRQDPDLSTVKELAEGSEIILTSWGCPCIDSSILEKAPGLKVVFHAAGSVKGVISPELMEKGIRVSSAAEAIGKGVAETALGLTIASLKYIWQLAGSVKGGEWSKGRENVRELYGVTIGVIGAGRAGKHYIRLLRNFDVEVLLYDPIIDDTQAKELGVRKVGLEELMKESDVVSIHAPSIPETFKMINERNLVLMKENAILINTARGSIVDEEVLAAELQKGRIYACLDVTDPEPPAADHPFRRLGNVILTPHIAGAVNNGLHRIGKYAVEELQRYIKGKRMQGEITLDTFGTIA